MEGVLWWVHARVVGGCLNVFRVRNLLGFIKSAFCGVFATVLCVFAFCGGFHAGLIG